MRKKTTKLEMNRETLRGLSQIELQAAAGGRTVGASNDTDCTKCAIGGTSIGSAFAC